MRSDLTEIVIVLDRSGSMQGCKEQAESGLNKFIEEQRTQPGEANLTLVQFDTEYEFVHTGKPIKEVPKFTLAPRGGTALFDAIGRAINETGERLRLMDESKRPGLVVFVILTDGEENSSREYTQDKIKEMISHQRDVYKWMFTFLGANQDAFKTAGAFGINRGSTANFAASCSANAFAASSGYVTRVRAMSLQGLEVEENTCAYTDEERKTMEGSK